MKASALLLASLASFTVLADPPTPPKPDKWEFLGTYQAVVAAGVDDVNVVIDPVSIGRSGDIVEAYVGRGFTEVNGHWAPAHGWVVSGYKIDCKFHTYNELWYQVSGAFGDTRNEWLTIESNSPAALAAKRVCR